MALESSTLVGGYGGRLLIMGSAPCFWDDLAAYESLGLDHDRMAINLVGILYEGRYEHWASIHMDRPIFNPKHLRNSSVMKAVPEDLFPPFLMHGLLDAQDFAYGWDLPKTGTSSRFGVEVGLRLGYDEIVLAGVPLNDDGYFYGPTNPQMDFGNPYMHKCWEEVSQDWGGRVTSMSGWTRELLGGPDARA